MLDIFHKEPHALNEAQQLEVNEIKDKAAELYQLISECLPVSAPQTAPRYISLAKTALEESVMWAVKGITE